eukprot:NODE_5323_length_1030_cov_52.868798_g4755_i0.p1 GENE.NODE_5323_length_1030_cov_52.868798_g4755_i0~~NODE_5323_length_1030_cov_52.868798_g4755_i0.p1  ORF type:complete len:169 (+),score=43.20 NODE_5323_length_1030_cov_52.868798_g4755_i0:120-626(+)
MGAVLSPTRKSAQSEGDDRYYEDEGLSVEQVRYIQAWLLHVRESNIGVKHLDSALNEIKETTGNDPSPDDLPLECQPSMDVEELKDKLALTCGNLARLEDSIMVESKELSYYSKALRGTQASMRAIGSTDLHIVDMSTEANHETPPARKYGNPLLDRWYKPPEGKAVG